MIRNLRILRRRRKENVKKAIGLISKTTNLLVHRAFFWTFPCTTATWKCPDSTFYGERNEKKVSDLKSLVFSGPSTRLPMILNPQFFLYGFKNSKSTRNVFKSNLPVHTYPNSLSARQLICKEIFGSCKNFLAILLQKLSYLQTCATKH